MSVVKFFLYITKLTLYVLVVVSFILTMFLLERIVDIELSGLLARTAVMGYKVSISKEVREQIIKEGSDPRYGARPLRRAIQTHVEDVITDILLNRIPENAVRQEEDQPVDILVEI